MSAEPHVGFRKSNMGELLEGEEDVGKGFDEALEESLSGRVRAGEEGTRTVAEVAARVAARVAAALWRARAAALSGAPATAARIAAALRRARTAAFEFGAASGATAA